MRCSPGFLLAALLSCTFGAHAASLAPRRGDQVFDLARLVERGSGLQGDGAVQYDSKSIYVAGERIFVYSEEVHPWRLPSPGLWRDVLEKVKSAGFNTISTYTHWGIVSPSPDAVHLTSFNDLGAFLDVAKDVGLFVILRPGPYINAETTNGGIPPWLHNVDGVLRQNSTAYMEAQMPYLKAVTSVARSYQLSLGSDGKLDPSSGPIIFTQVENEYSDNEPEKVAYFEELKQVLRNDGIRTLFSFNNCCTPAGGDFANDVDLYGMDGYPLGFDCSNPQDWGSGVQTSIYPAFNKIKPDQVKFIPEYQGGSFDPWGGVGYEKCYELVGPDFARVYGQSLFSEDIRAMSYYMGFGGTSWAGIPFSGVYSSYNYAAGIDEDRSLRDKHREYASTAGFWSAFSDFIGAARISAGTGNDVVSSSTPIYTGKFAGSNSQTYYVARQADSTSFSTATFKMNVTTVNGPRTIPAEGTFTLLGRDSRLVVVNGMLSNGSRLLYSTASPSFARSIGGRDVVVLHGDAGNSFEAVFTANSNGNNPFTAHLYDSQGRPAKSGATVTTSTRGEARINWTAAKNTATHVLLRRGATEILVLLLDTLSQYRTYQPPIASKGSLEYFAGTGELALVSGPYLVRNATISGSTLQLAGAANVSAPIEVVTRPGVQSIVWNGQSLATSKTPYGTLMATVPGPSSAALSFKPPTLSSLTWKYADSFPEAQPDFDDSTWTTADKTSTPNDYFQSSVVQTEGQVLFTETYGFFANNIIWRGRFDSQGNEAGIYFHTETGSYSGAALYLNGQFLGTLEPDSTYSDAFQNFTFPKRALKKTGNVLTLIHDSTGYPEDGGLHVPIGNRDAAPGDAKLVLQDLKMPQGIIAYDLLKSDNTSAGTSIKQWKVQGNLGGENPPDLVRTAINEGGLFAEREGWHLPGFDDSKWAVSSPMQGVSNATVAFYRTTFTLDAPRDHDIPMSLQFSEDAGTNMRILLWINGWQYGRRWTKWGPQTRFVLPPGLLDPQGENTLAISLWNLRDESAKIGSISLEVDGVYTGTLEYPLNNPGYAQLRK